MLAFPVFFGVVDSCGLPFVGLSWLCFALRLEVFSVMRFFQVICRYFLVGSRFVLPRGSVAGCVSPRS